MSSTDHYIRKSMLESYEFCPMQFFKDWIMPSERNANQKMLVGTRFHDFADKFFDYALGFPPDMWDDFIPTEDFNDEEVEMAKWFLDYQRGRYAELQVRNALDEFVPIYKELFMICDAVQLKSTLDFSEWDNKEKRQVCLGEYKTGENLKEEEAFRQLAFYAILWLQSGNPGEVTSLKLINPRLKVVKKVPFTEELATTAIKRVQKLRDAIDQSKFPYRCTDGKYAACKRCRLEELPKIFPDDGYDKVTDIYNEPQAEKTW